MSDQFPLRPDPDWYAALVARFGDAVPAVEHVRVRRGLQQIVSDMYAQLSDLDLLRHVDIYGIETRTAAWVILDARYRDGIYEDDRIALDFALEKAQERLSEVCEHCGRGGALILKIGEEARLADPSVELGDRLLCEECYESWSAA